MVRFETTDQYDSSRAYDLLPTSVSSRRVFKDHPSR